MTKRYVSVKEACARWSVGSTYMYGLLKAGLIVAVKLGRRTLVDVESGDRYFASLPRFQ